MLIGITGSIASGKSTLSKYISKKYPVIDADILARKIFEPSHIAYKELIDNFGSAIINQDKTLNRKSLASIIFNDKNKRELLNSISHKHIKNEFKKEYQKFLNMKHNIIFYDIPLLFETNSQKMFNIIILIYIPLDLQITRLMKRNNIDKNNALKMINSQMSLKEKKTLSDYIIDNSKNIENSYEQFDKIMDKILNSKNNPNYTKH